MDKQKKEHESYKDYYKIKIEDLRVMIESLDNGIKEEESKSIDLED